MLTVIVQAVEGQGYCFSKEHLPNKQMLALPATFESAVHEKSGFRHTCNRRLLQEGLLAEAGINSSMLALPGTQAFVVLRMA